MEKIVTLDTADSTKFRLRLLQTTDLHMHLLPFNYGTMQPSQTFGLANLVSQIDVLRADNVPTLLFDTGDFLQGTPLADLAMQSDARDLHPIAYAFNALKYDAIALGNHDFDYGIKTLGKIIAQIDCPVLSANVTLKEAGAPYAATTLISVPLSKEANAPSIKVGVVGLTTPALALVDHNGGNTLVTADPVVIAKVAVNELKQQGADIIVALCHFGIDPDDHTENVAADIAGIDGIDTVMAGHTHETFPAGTTRHGKAINLSAGTIHDTPTVMSGAFGQQLGVVDRKSVV